MTAQQPKIKKRPIITEDTESDEEQVDEQSEESYFEIEDTPELDHPARNTGDRTGTAEIVSVNNEGAQSLHSVNTLSSNSSWKDLKYTDTTSIDILRNALIADVVKQTGFK